MAHIYAKDGQIKSNLISDVFYEGEYADTNIYVTGVNEKECVELLGDLQEQYGELTHYSVVDYDEVLFFNQTSEKEAENERKYINSYENPQYRDYWGLNDDPDEQEPPEPDDYPDLTGGSRLKV